MTKVKWTDVTTIQRLLNEHTTRQDVVQAMGYHPNNYHASKQLANAISENELTANFVQQKMPERYNILPDIISDCFSYSDAIRACGLSDVGSNHSTIKKYIKELNLDVTHFVKRRMNSTKIPNETMFVEHSVVARATVRNRVLSDSLVEYVCSECGIGDEWNGVKLTLQLDHRNGNNTDNRLDNLQFLCPNCHSQTTTWGAKDRNNKPVLTKPGQQKFVDHKNNQDRIQKEVDEQIQQLKNSVINSGIDFIAYGWVNKVAEVLKCEPQYVGRWMRQHLPELYETCYKRRSRLVDRTKDTT